MRRVLTVLVSLIVAFSGLSLPLTTAAAAPSEPATTEEIVAKGVRLVFVAGDSPNASVFAVMLAGRGSQSPGETHVAHALEHMVIMNPDARDISVAKYVSAYKGTFNGYTGLDHTQFELTLPANELPKAVSRLLRSMFSSTVSDAAVAAELSQRLTPELRFMTSHRLSALLNAGELAVLKGTRYYEARFSVPVARVTASQINAFRQREYSPRRLTLVICGNVDRAAMKSAIAEALADVPAGEAPVQPEPVVLSPSEEASLLCEGTFSPRIVAGLTVNGVSPTDQLAAQATLMLIGDRVRNADLAGLEPIPEAVMTLPLNGAMGFLIGYAGSGSNALIMDGQRQQASVRQALLAAVSDLRQNGPTDEEIAGLIGSQSEPAQFPSTIDPTLVQAFMVGTRYIPTLSGISDDTGTPQQGLATRITAFLADHPRIDSFSVYVHSKGYFRYVMTRILAGLGAIAVVAALVIWNRRRRALSRVV